MSQQQQQFDQPPFAAPTTLAYTIRQLLQLAGGMSSATFWGLVAEGRGPVMFQPGKRKWLIASPDAVAWIARLREERQPSIEDRAQATARAKAAAAVHSANARARREAQPARRRRAAKARR